MRKLLIGVSIVSCVALVLALTLTATAREGLDYHVSGRYWESCSCAPSCPCIFTSDPTEGHCKASIVWHVDEGTSGGIDVSGTSVVVTLVSDGHMTENLGKFRGVMYLPDTLSTEQQNALGKAFHAQFGAMFGSMVGPKIVPIEFEHDGNNYSAKIGETLDVAIEPIRGPDGSVSSIADAPFALTDRPLMVSQSVRHTYNDEGLDSWDMGAGRSAFFAEFEYVSAQD